MSRAHRAAGRAGRRSHREMGDPVTPEDWELAVNAAAALRMIADCKMYGLLQGGPSIDVQRCDHLIERGAALGVFPSHPVVDMAVELISQFNSPPPEEQQP